MHASACVKDKLLWLLPHLQHVYEVGGGQHAAHAPLLAVPQRRTRNACKAGMRKQPFSLGSCTAQCSCSEHKHMCIAGSLAAASASTKAKRGGLSFSSLLCMLHPPLLPALRCARTLLVQRMEGLAHGQVHI